MNTPPSGGGTPPGQGGQGDPSGSPPLPPPAPAHQPPSAQSPTQGQNLNQAQAATQKPGGGGAPPGHSPQANRTSGGDHEEDNNPNRRSTGMKAGTAILILGTLFLITMVIFGFKSCSTVDNIITKVDQRYSAPGGTPPPGATPDAGSANGTTPGPGTTNNTAAPPSGSRTFTAADANALKQCNDVTVGRSSTGWYMVGKPNDSPVPIAARMCIGKEGPFRAAESARLVNLMFYIKEGGREMMGDVNTKLKLSDFTNDKFVNADVTARVEGYDKSYRLENPYVVFIDPGAFEFCQYYKSTAKPPKDDHVGLEIWARCQAGGPLNNGVAQTLANNRAYFAREDGAALAAKLQKIEQQVAANGNKPVAPKEVDYNASGASK